MSQITVEAQKNEVSNQVLSVHQRRHEDVLLKKIFFRMRILRRRRAK